MKNLFGVSLLILGGLSVSATELGNTIEQVTREKGLPPGKMGANGFVILAYADSTIWLQNNKVVRLSGPPRRASIVPALKPRPKPKPVLVWTDDVDTAISEAREKNRQVLLLFAGSGGAPLSQRFESEVLTTPEFFDYAKDHLILVKLDFPSVAGGRANSPTPTPTVLASVNPPSTPGATENPASAEALAKTASSPSPLAPPETKPAPGDAFPVVFILDSEGRPLGSFAYTANGPLPFIESLKKLAGQNPAASGPTPTPSAVSAVTAGY